MPKVAYLHFVKTLNTTLTCLHASHQYLAIFSCSYCFLCWPITYHFSSHIIEEGCFSFTEYASICPSPGDGDKSSRFNRFFSFPVELRHQPKAFWVMGFLCSILIPMRYSLLFNHSFQKPNGSGTEQAADVFNSGPFVYHGKSTFVFPAVGWMVLFWACQS